MSAHNLASVATSTHGNADKSASFAHWRDTYLFRCDDHSMHPRIKHRESVIVMPNGPLLIGDEAVVRMTDGTASIVVLQGVSSDAISVSTLASNPASVAIRLADVAAIHSIAGVICRKNIVGGEHEAA